MRLECLVVLVRQCLKNDEAILKGHRSHFYKFIFKFIYFEGDRERQSASRGRAERKGDKESKVGSKLGAVSTEPDMGLELTNHKITN